MIQLGHGVQEKEYTEFGVAGQSHAKFGFLLSSDLAF